jgi:hypothetical protein
VGLAVAALWLVGCEGRRPEGDSHAWGSGYGVGRPSPARILAAPNGPRQYELDRRPLEQATYIPGQTWRGARPPGLDEGPEGRGAEEGVGIEADAD